MSHLHRLRWLRERLPQIWWECPDGDGFQTLASAREHIDMLAIGNHGPFKVRARLEVTLFSRTITPTPLDEEDAFLLAVTHKGGRR